MGETDQCNLCGKCNSCCAVYRTVRRETRSNRNKAYTAIKQQLTLQLHTFLLDGSIRDACPAGVDIDREIRRLREAANATGVQTAANRKIIADLRRWGNPYGNPAELRKKAGR